MPWGMIAATVVGGLLQSDSASSAAYDQRLASDKSLALQKEQADRAYADYAPYREVGVNALRTLAGEVDRPTTAADVMTDPGYQFGLQQGQQAIDRQFARNGGRNSGAQIKAAARFGTNYATAGYGAADQRRENRKNRLAALAQIGQTSTGASAQAGMAYGANAGNTMVNQGDNSGAGRLAQGNVWGNAANQIGALYGRSQRGGQGGGFGGVGVPTDDSGNGWY